MFDEELASHLFASLTHVEFAREMLLRVGNVETFERHGWAFGDEAYTGMPEMHVIEGHLITVLAMTEPRLTGDVSHVCSLNEGRDEWWRGVLHATGERAEEPEQLPLEEADFGHALIVSSSDPELLERYRAGLIRLNPAQQLFAHDPEPQRPPSVRLAARPLPPREAPTPPNFLVFLDPWDGGATDTAYAIIRRLVRVWETEKVRRAAAAQAVAQAVARRSGRTFPRPTTFGGARNHRGRR